MERVKGYADRWQPDGVGRVFLDATGFAGSTPPQDGAGAIDHATIDRDLLGWCQALAGAVRGLGWGPAVGVTGSKFGAGVAGQVAWQNAALLLAPAAQRAFLAGQPVTALPLDADALIQLRHLGIRTLGQFTRLPATGVLTRFGPAGRTAQHWAQGLDDRPVTPPWEAPEVSARIEFDPPLADRERLLLALARQAQQLLAPLRERLQAAARLSLAVVRTDGRTVPVSHVFPVPTAAAETVRLALTAAVARVAWHDEGAAEIILTFAGITDAPGGQLTLFDLTPDSRARLTRDPGPSGGPLRGGRLPPGIAHRSRQSAAGTPRQLAKLRMIDASLAVRRPRAGDARPRRPAPGLPVARRLAPRRRHRQSLAGAGQLVVRRGLAGICQAHHRRWPALHPGP